MMQPPHTKSTSAGQVTDGDWLWYGGEVRQVDRVEHDHRVRNGFDHRVTFVFPDGDRVIGDSGQTCYKILDLDAVHAWVAAGMPEVPYTPYGARDPRDRELTDDDVRVLEGGA